MIPENRHIIDVRMNKNDLEILIRGSEEIIPEDSFLEKIKGKKKLRIKAGLETTSPDLQLGNTVLLNNIKLYKLKVRIKKYLLIKIPVLKNERNVV